MTKRLSLILSLSIFVLSISAFFFLSAASSFTVTQAIQSGADGGACGIVMGLDGNEAPGPVTSVWFTITYFAILFAPVTFLKWKQRLAKSTNRVSKLLPE